MKNLLLNDWLAPYALDLNDALASIKQRAWTADNFKFATAVSVIMKHILITLICVLAINQHIKGQNLSSELNAIALDNDMMGGAVVVFCENQVMSSFYFGKSDIQRNIDVNQHTKFRIASISKTITAIAIMQLVDQNLLDLNTDITTILGFNVRNPNYPNTAITVKMLLSHTSSIIDGSTYDAFLQATTNNNTIPNLSEILTPSGSFYNTDQFNNILPGTYFNYSNINYVILGTIVEKISHIRFDIYCLQKIFQPLGIDASFNVNDLQNIDDVAVLYRKTNGSWTPQADNYQGVQPVFANVAGYVPGTNGGRFGPQGGLRCTAEDLSKIFRCIFNPNLCETPLLSSQSISNMMANQWTFNGNNGNNYYGLFRSWGLGIHRITSTPGNDVVLPGSAAMFGHTGEAHGLVSDAYYDTTRNVGVVFITNGVGVGYQTNNNSAFYTVEHEIFNAIEDFGHLNSCLTLGTDAETNQEDSFYFFPNPTSNAINLSVKNFTRTKNLQIFSADATLVMETNIHSPQCTIDVSHLQRGVYILQMEGRKKRFIKI